MVRMITSIRLHHTIHFHSGSIKYFIVRFECGHYVISSAIGHSWNMANCIECDKPRSFMPDDEFLKQIGISGGLEVSHEK